MNNHFDVMEVLSAKASAATYGGAITMVGSGVIVIFGYQITQIQIAFISMLIGAIVGISGIIINIVFKWMAHQEQKRINKVKEAALREKGYFFDVH